MNQNSSAKHRKRPKSENQAQDNVGSGKIPQHLKQSIAKNLFCVLGNLFGLQSSENADVGPQRPSKETIVYSTIPQTQSAPPPTQFPQTEVIIIPNKPRKSIFLAYVFWLFGGVFGLHLFYLERDAHAFLTWSTLGGYGLGWLADITKIPRYVRDCNNDPKFLQDLIEKMRRNRKPPFSTSRFISALMVGYLWGQLVMLAIPEDEVYGINLNTYLHWFIPLAVALGVWIVGNIGREQGSPKVTIITSYLSYFSRWYFFDENIWLTIVMFTAAFTFDTYSKEWRRQPKKKKPLTKRLGVLVFCGILYIGLWSSYLYFNGKITDSNGDEIPIHEALHHFFTSPWWTDLKQSLYETYQYAQVHGWYEIWKQIIELSDPQGEQNSYKVLGVSPTASQQEITARWRALSREHHPDKVKDPEKQRDAQERFMQIQQAYEILSKIKNKRRRKNNKSVN
ncbi:dnaJ homolog subfamily C member 22 isoform X2 [Sitophilus oryzae]|uniref:DnaJ homolog subfamily C member 22 n=1 Tax=Sitophilus oryzae TaxID=7048 RepID=A0A6J2X7L6_SITOR|nr:dnaJ homolog subfamily C member 22 isoform X2 [Sitophilus oryzae]